MAQNFVITKLIKLILNFKCGSFFIVSNSKSIKRGLNFKLLAF